LKGHGFERLRKNAPVARFREGHGFYRAVKAIRFLPAFSRSGEFFLVISSFWQPLIAVPLQNLIGLRVTQGLTRRFKLMAVARHYRAASAGQKVQIGSFVCLQNVVEIELVVSTFVNRLR